MRRFPPPPGGILPSTPSTTTIRSKDTPMDYEFENPRSYPTSPFNVAATKLGAGGVEDDGERARKRTHYEAMDVDTPPRPSFPASATATTNPFHFAQPSDAPTSTLHSLEFDSNKFVPEEAFGLDDSMREGDGGDDDVEEEQGKGIVAVLSGGGGNESRRRRGGGGKKESGGGGRRRSVELVDDSEEEDEEEGDDRGMGLGLGGGPSTNEVRRRMKSSDFSFQVHHHHGPSGSEGGFAPTLPERWLNSNTPYTLLGYLQFGSLTLLAILVLFISLLFLYTLYTDIQARLQSLTFELRAEILQCAKAYVDNRCEPKTRLPAMERRCSEWEECMGREVVVAGRTRVVAETLAEIVNGFVDVISLKTMLFVILTLGLCIYGSSVALSLLPSRPTPPSHSNTTPTIAPPHFQHLGYPPYAAHPQQGYAYPPLPSPGYGATAPWIAEAAGKLGGESLDQGRKGWFGGSL